MEAIPLAKRRLVRVSPHTSPSVGMRAWIKVYGDVGALSILEFMWECEHGEPAFRMGWPACGLRSGSVFIAFARPADVRCADGAVRLHARFGAATLARANVSQRRIGSAVGRGLPPIGPRLGSVNTSRRPYLAAGGQTPDRPERRIAGAIGRGLRLALHRINRTRCRLHVSARAHALNRRKRRIARTIGALGAGQASNAQCADNDGQRNFESLAHDDFL